jgi:PAS domain S-box-containing protein
MGQWMIVLALTVALLLLLLGLGLARLTLLELNRSLDYTEEAGSHSLAHKILERMPLYGQSFASLASRMQTLARAEQLATARYSIVTTNTAAAMILHEPDGSISWASPYTEVITGYSISEVMASGASFFPSNVHEDDRELIQRAAAIVATGEPFQCRYRFYHRSGMVLWLETRTVPISDPGSDEFVALSITIDITASAMNQLQIEERSRDLHEFTYMISHDLKAPIVTIRGMLTVLNGDEAINTPSVQEPLNYIERAAKRLEELVGGVLELAHVSATERVMKPVSLSDVLHDVIRDFDAMLSQAGGALTIEGDLPEVLGHRMHLYQIFSNLIGNAIKYRSSERPLLIILRMVSTRSPRRVTIEVEDNGIGIPEEKRSRAFKPFQRLGEASVEGTGVGLACVKKLVDRSSGTIQIRDGASGGTLFAIELRRAATTE